MDYGQETLQVERTADGSDIDSARATGESSEPADRHVRPRADGHESLSRFERRVLDRLLQAVGRPDVIITLWTGEEFRPAGPPVGRLHLRDRGTLWRLLVDPQFQFGEAYADGRVELDGDLVGVVCELSRAMKRSQGSAISKGLSRVLHRPHRTKIAAARENIHHHYDIGNEFYRLWLDEQLVYTCAYFRSRDDSLEQAQVDKFEHVCRKVWLRPGDRVIEAGCGWGALALHMARRYGARVRAYNISKEQLAYARERARAEGLADRVEFIEDDWRNIRGQCDVFMSVGMLEHVGIENYRELGDVLHRTLTPEGRGLIHSIGRNQPRLLDPWIERRIFPGACPPALSEVTRIFEPHSFSVLDIENIRLHYAKTLEHWLRRFEHSLDRVRQMFDERFVRMWRLYLAASQAAFEVGSLQLFQIAFAREENNDLPWTRARLYDHSAGNGHAAFAGNGREAHDGPR